MDKSYLSKIDNVIGMFYYQCDKYADNTLIKYKSGEKFHDMTWNRIKELVENISLFLIESGVKKGDKVAIFAFNRFEWWIADMASLSVGAVVVPVYSTNSQEEVLYILKNSETKYVFTGDDIQRDKVIQCSKKYKKIARIISFDDLPKKPGCINFSKAVKDGSSSRKLKILNSRKKSISEKNIATIIYTSGTTGDPKGVVLTHRNIYSDVVQLVDVFADQINPDDIFLSFLPLSHALERTAGYYAPIALGCQVAFAEGFTTVLEDMKLVRPTVLISVPRLYEKIHSGVLASSKKFSFFKQMLFKASLFIGRRRVRYVIDFKKPSGIDSFLTDFAESLIFSKIKAAIGLNRLKISVSGGGPLTVSDLNFFLGMNIMIYEGFGLTEASPVTNVNRPGKIKPGTVGPSMCFTEMKISDEGEVLFNGPNIMKGYYKNPSATKEAFTKDGWLKSGDIGLIDEDGFLIITGRIKDIIVTAGGKNISPQNIEGYLKRSPYIEQIAIIGDRRKFLSCLVVPDFEAIRQWAVKNKKNLDFNDRKSVTENSDVVNLFEQILLNLVKDFSRVEQIKKFRLISDEWSVETGELTPSLKIKRKVIEEKYKLIIEEIYQ
ncbi:MAG: long-chain fatty acid--CoA ligase [Spirochaetes bacterium]|nr:long-chain fatty acid--CoA ligase [Spirochaetota bacterium]